MTDTPRVFLAVYHDGLSPRYEVVPEGAMGAEPWVPEGAGVRVKALEWENDPDDVMDIISGHYAIEVLTLIWVIYCGKHIGKGFKKMADAVAFANAHNESRIRAAIELTTEPEPTSGWRDDPESSEAWCAGNDYALTRLCKVLGVDPDKVSWDGSDGSLDEEADALIWRILNAKEEQEPTSGAYDLICCTAEDVATGRGFMGDAAADLAMAQESLRDCLKLLGWSG